MTKVLTKEMAFGITEIPRRLFVTLCAIASTQRVSAGTVISEMVEGCLQSVYDDAGCKPSDSGPTVSDKVMRYWEHHLTECNEHEVNTSE